MEDNGTLTKSPYIMGFQKCGINSIIKYYKDKIDSKSDGFKDTSSVHTTEDITSIHCLPTFEPFRETHFPVVITRNKVDAIWSIYWFFGYHKSHTLEEFLKIDEPSIQYGNNNPINRVDYEYHLSKFEGVEDVVVHKLEEMPELEHKNKTRDMFEQYDDLQGYRQSKTMFERELIEKALRSYDRNKLKHKVKLV